MRKLITALFLIQAFYIGERMAGLNKICYYDDMGSTIAITISALDLCPMEI